MKRNTFLARLLPVLALTLLGFLVMGYHPGYEDDGVYLAALKADLNPALYPHDANFFQLQMQATLFDEGMTLFVRDTRTPLAWAELFWQLTAIFLILWACAGIAHHLFAEPHARWAGVALVSAMLTLPVAGTALNLADQHLHPRNLASALILLAVERILARRRRQAALFLLIAFAIHPIMALLGISFCCFLALALHDPLLSRLRRPRAWLAAVPLGWVVQGPSPDWYRALATRRYFFLTRWTWYEWLGAIGPLVLFWLLWRVSRRHGHRLLARFALAVLAYALFQQAFAIAVLAPPAFARVAPLQPMRYLQLVYFFMVLIGGCLLGKFLLKTAVWRWAVLLILTNGGMFVAQRRLLPASPHLELPGRRSSNPWLQAFAWIRVNTPVDACFAMNPRYLAAPGEDYHSFRALAERSQLADAIKDASVATQVPQLSHLWVRQVDAASGWESFKPSDFQRLKREYSVNWVLVRFPQPAGLDCVWHNRILSVCRIP